MVSCTPTEIYFTWVPKLVVIAMKTLLRAWEQMSDCQMQFSIMSFACVVTS